MEEVRVELGERSYSICIGPGILDGLGRAVRDFGFSRVAVVSNPTVYGIYGERVLGPLKAAGCGAAYVTVPDGEEYKELLWAYYLYGELLRLRLDRSSALIALGGGVVGDLTGFVASTYMRGIPFIQVPTTLLAQVDSSVGGKTGVNHPLGKNIIGTFHQPVLVWADVETLKTLARRELLAGMAEVIKYGVIRDPEFFHFLEDRRDDILGLEPGAIAQVIRRSCEIKAEVVSSDEREAGLRAVLNYGHTVGHAIETATGYSSYLHGEAVAIGMCAEAHLARLLGSLDSASEERIRSLVRSYGLPDRVPPGIEPERLIASMELDKKAVAGTLRFVLPGRIGAVTVEAVGDRSKIAAALKAQP